MMSHNVGILFCFVMFLVSILIFACIYYRLYQNNPNHFLFSSEICRSQRDAFAKDTTAKIGQLEAALEAMDYWAALLGAGVSIQSLYRRESPDVLPSGRRTEIEKWTRPISPSGYTDYDFVCVVWDTEGNIVTRKSLPSSLLKDFLADTHEKEQAARKAEIAMLKQRLTDLTTESPFVWSFWDFLYFSAISQTTVGYGDILPNATSVRLFVVLQILVGYAILVVLLNILLGTAAT